MVPCGYATGGLCNCVQQFYCVIVVHTGSGVLLNSLREKSLDGNICCSKSLSL